MTFWAHIVLLLINVWVFSGLLFYHHILKKELKEVRALKLSLKNVSQWKAKNFKAALIQQKILSGEIESIEDLERRL